MMPGTNSIPPSTIMSRGLCAKEPARLRPYASSVVQVKLSAVPQMVMKALTPTALVTTPPDKIDWYAARLASSGHNTNPPIG